jgi:COP9 signalosome complex subunit 5
LQLVKLGSHPIQLDTQMAGSSSAQKRWELENDVQNVEGCDAYYKYDAAEQQALQQQKPWTKDPHYFKK